MSVEERSQPRLTGSPAARSASPCSKNSREIRSHLQAGMHVIGGTGRALRVPPRRLLRVVHCMRQAALPAWRPARCGQAGQEVPSHVPRNDDDVASAAEVQARQEASTGTPFGPPATWSGQGAAQICPGALGRPGTP